MKYSQLVKAIDSASRHLLGRAVAIVNQSLVIRNWLVGAYVVEFEQHGSDRASYGARLLQSLAKDLKTRKVTGMGISILERSRRFYLIYPEFRSVIPEALLAHLAGPHSLPPRQIPYTLSTESGVLESSSRGAIPYAVSMQSADGSRPTANRRAQSSSSTKRGISPLSPEALLRLSWSHWSELIRLDDRARFEALAQQQEHRPLKGPPARKLKAKGRPGIYSRSRNRPAHSGRRG